ncbi:MAG: hypothetical protein LPJ89_09425, partial [Hymenobacteraceae bacterium]|nr:hypothetical protein [Hymenobacteraceae bacterium]MDX5395560.1 hypothetical protein [Hymenobacteraceae bacterium]MDX5443986.1 hypothetical protein [Hymenobacteraceae bacterium]MDX5511614.1 hypothetical protein [Hymenobacteraceae bacterium]
EKESGLITQWAFYGQAQDEKPSFIRRFDDYKQYGPVKLSTNRDSETDNLRITDLVVTNDIDERIFYSTRPIDKALVK